MSDMESKQPHFLQQSSRRRCSTCEYLNRIIDLSLLMRLGLKEDAENNGRAAHMGNFVQRNVSVHIAGGGVAHADIGSTTGSNTPCEGPAIAVEHWEGPQINWFASHFPANN
uniref:Uncharacterized protein n=1 Tax=Rhizophora mucronata TaxID=61149 RepID=A0A2P2NQX5_RHIMU